MVEFDSSVYRLTFAAYIEKRGCHHRKLKILICDKSENKRVLEPKLIPDFMVNMSTEQFTEDEINLLNRGVKFTPEPNETNVTESVVDIETILKFNLPSTQNVIRKRANKVIEKVDIRNKKTSTNDQFDTIESLKKENCFL